MSQSNDAQTVAVPSQAVAAVETKRSRGRPATGNAKTPTQRVKALDANLEASGGRVLNRTRLAAEAAVALADLSKLYGSDRAAIEAALIDLHNKRCAQR